MNQISLQLKPNESQLFQEAVLDLFNGRASGNLYSYMYAEPAHPMDNAGGGESWHDFLENTQAYHVVREEAEAIQGAAQHLSAIIPENLTSIELAVGDLIATGLKTIRFNKAVKPSKFIAVDINGAYAESASQAVGKELGIPVQAIETDFLDGPRINYPSPSVYSLFGGLLSNIPCVNGVDHLDMLATYFGKLREMMNRGDYLVITQDSCRDQKKLRAAYNDPLLATCAMSILHRIARDLPTKDFNPRKFEYEGIFFPHSENQGLCVRSKITQTFEIAGHRFTIPEGKIFTLINSYKFNPIDFMNAARNAGFIPASNVLSHMDTRLHTLRV